MFRASTSSTGSPSCPISTKKLFVVNILLHWYRTGCDRQLSISARNSSNNGACQAGGDATVTDTAIAIGGDERGGAKVGIGVGVGIDRDIYVVIGPAFAIEVGPDIVIDIFGADIVTDVFTCYRTLASV